MQHRMLEKNKIQAKKCQVIVENKPESSENARMQIHAELQIGCRVQKMLCQELRKVALVTARNKLNE